MIAKRYCHSAQSAPKGLPQAMTLFELSELEHA